MTITLIQPEKTSLFETEYITLEGHVALSEQTTDRVKDDISIELREIATVDDNHENLILSTDANGKYWPRYVAKTLMSILEEYEGAIEKLELVFTSREDVKKPPVRYLLKDDLLIVEEAELMRIVTWPSDKDNSPFN